MMRIGLLVFIGLFNFSWSAVYAQYESIVSTEFPEQYKKMDSLVNILVKKDEKAAIAELDLLGKAASNLNDPLTTYNYKRSILKYRLMVMGESDDSVTIKSLIYDSQSLLNEINEARFPLIAALVHINIGLVFQYKSAQYNDAFHHYLMAYNLFKSVSVEEFPDRQYSQYSIALLYYSFNDFITAVGMGKEIEALYPVKNYVSIFTVNLIGMSYLKMKQYDSAIVQFQWILDHYKSCKVSAAWEGIALGNMGKVYFFQSDYKKALPFLEQGVKRSQQFGLADNVAAFAAPLSSIFLKKDAILDAGRYVDLARQAAYQSNTLSEYQVVYQAMSDYYRMQGNTKLALLYMDSSIIYRDSLERKKDVGLKFQTEMNMANELSNAREKLLRDEKKTQVLIRNGILIFTLLLMSIVLLAYNRQRLKNSYREQQLMAQNQISKTELKLASNQLNDFTQSIIEKNALLEKAFFEIERMNAVLVDMKHHQHEKEQLTSDTTNTINQLQQSVILTEEDWKDFSGLFEKVYPGFLVRLKSKLPELTPAESRFIALSKMNLNNKEMAAMLGVSTDAMRQNRSRLKKKFGFSDDGQLENVIQGV